MKYVDFGKFAQGLSERLKKHAEALANTEGRPFLYLSSAGQSKEEVATAIAKRDGITEGLVCVLRCVEPCMRSRRAHRRTAGARVQLHPRHPAAGLVKGAKP